MVCHKSRLDCQGVDVSRETVKRATQCRPSFNSVSMGRPLRSFELHYYQGYRLKRFFRASQGVQRHSQVVSGENGVRMQVTKNPLPRSNDALLDGQRLVMTV